MTKNFNELYEKFEATRLEHNLSEGAQVPPELWVRYFESLTPEGKVLAAEIVLENAARTVDCILHHSNKGII